MYPPASALNLTPNSSALPSLPFGPGVVVSVQILHGHVGAVPVVKAQVTSAARGFPARSFTPLAPPLTVAVYDVPALSAAEGVNVAVAPLPDTLAATATLVAVFFSVKVVVDTVVGSIASLKVAVTEVVGLTPVAPLTGLVDEITGGVVSGGSEVTNTTSTQ